MRGGLEERRGIFRSGAPKRRSKRKSRRKARLKKRQSLWGQAGGNLKSPEKLNRLEKIIWPEPTEEEVKRAVALLSENKKHWTKQEIQDFVEERADRIRDVRQRMFAELEADLKGKEAMTDPLTGLKNRGGFEMRMESAIATAERYGEPFTILMIDIDHFKQFNDTYGHATGDQVLKEVATILKQTCRQTDMVARYGGEEFAVILEKATDEQGKQIAKKLRKAIEKKTKNKNHPPVTISVGLAEFKKGDPSLETADKLKESADKALYHAKAEGRNQAKAYQKNMTMPKDVSLLNEINKLTMRLDQLKEELSYRKEILEVIKKHKPELENRVRAELVKIQEEFDNKKSQRDEKQNALADLQKKTG